VAGEGVTLEPISLPFFISPNTDSLKTGDTILIKGITANTYNLNGGKLECKFYISYSDSIPQTDVTQSRQTFNGSDYLLINIQGNILYNSSVQGLILGLNTVPSGDSIVMSYKFVPLKKGLFVLGFSSSFYEGKTQKARTDAFFDVENHFWSYYQVPGQDLPLPGSDEYKRYYFIAVTD